MKTLVTIIFILFLSLLLFEKKTSLSKSFYYWENTYNIKNTKEKLYIKILEIAYNKKIELIKTKFTKKAPKDFIPVIYITNETMKKVDYKKIFFIIKNFLEKSNFSFKHLQIDCDWSLSSKSNYFNLLKALKKEMKKTLSATIRLHQIKYYKKTGVPSIDYGVLMYYNMSDIASFNTKNSILDNQIAKKYHHNFDTYPLKLKLALPLYSQAIQFRNKKALEIFEGVKASDFQKNFIKLENNYYKVKNSTYFKGRYIYKNDIFRFEDIDYKNLKIALNDFIKLRKNRYNEVIFYTIKYKNKFNLKHLLKEY